MKKYIILAVSALLFVACSNDEEITKWNGEIRLCTTTLLQTRAAQNIQGDQFEQNEKVDIYINEETDDVPTITYPQPLVYTADGDGGLANDQTQSYPESNGVRIYGIYPSGTAVDDNTTLPSYFEVKSDQTESANYKLSDLMFGEPASNPVFKQAAPVPVVFTHLLSKININVEADGETLTADDLVNATVKILTPFIACSIGRENDFLIDPIEGQFIEITAGILAANNMSCSAIIIPQECSGEFIQIVLANNGPTLTYSLPEATTTSAAFESGKMYTYNIRASRYNLNATTQIQPWGEEGPFEGMATN